MLAAPPPSATAAPPSLRGAATHPLWETATSAESGLELDKLTEAGANAVRIDIGWSTLEQAGKGTFSTSYAAKADTFFQQARERGIEVVATFWTTPCWASSAPADVKQDCQGSWWERGVHLYPPEDPSDFADAAAWVVQRWGPDLAALEIWNEPNLDDFFRSSDPAADYAPMLKAAYPAVKAVDPDVAVIGPAMVLSDGAFLEELYGEGISGHFDGISSRPFNQWRDPYDPGPATSRRASYINGVPWVREIMVAHGDEDKRLWFTELGWPSCAPSGTHSWCVTLEQQAQYIADAFRIIRDRWDYVHAALVYNLRNKGTNPGDFESQMGLLYRDFSPKPSYHSFKAVMAEMATSATPDPPPAPEAGPSAPPQGVDATIGPVPPSPATPVVATLDSLPPALTRLRLSKRAFRSVGAGSRLAPVSGGTTVRYALSEAAAVRFRVERGVPGRMAGGRCVAASPRGRVRRPCIRYVGVRGALAHKGRRGENRFRFTGRLAGRTLRPGRYRLTATATDLTGNRSSPARKEFRILRLR